jgi:hypothetical protein
VTHHACLERIYVIVAWQCCGMAMLIVFSDIGLDNGINENYTVNVMTQLRDYSWHRT